MSLKKIQIAAINDTTIVFTHIFKCELWVANALLQILQPYLPGIKNVIKTRLSYQKFGRATGVHFGFVSSIKHPTNQIPKELRDLFLQCVNVDEQLAEIERRLYYIIRCPLYQSIKFFHAFSLGLKNPSLDKNGIPTKPVPNVALYKFLIENREKVKELKSVKKIHEWLLRESRFKPTEANFRKMCSRLGLCFRKN